MPGTKKAEKTRAEMREVMKDKRMDVMKEVEAKMVASDDGPPDNARGAEVQRCLEVAQARCSMDKPPRRQTAHVFEIGTKAGPDFMAPVPAMVMRTGNTVVVIVTDDNLMETLGAHK